MQYAAGATPVRVRKIICGHDRLAYFPNETTRKNICATINLPAAVAASNKSRANTAIAKKSRYIHYTRPLYAFPAPPSLSFAGDSLAGRPTQLVTYCTRSKENGRREIGCGKCVYLNLVGLLWYE